MNEPEYICTYCALEISPRLLCRACADELGLTTPDQIRRYVVGMNNLAERDEKLTGRSSHRMAHDSAVRPSTQNYSLGEGHTQLFGWEGILIKKRDYDE